MDKTTKVVLIIAIVALLLMFLSLGHDLFIGRTPSPANASSVVSQVQSVSAAS